MRCRSALMMVAGLLVWLAVGAVSESATHGAAANNAVILKRVQLLGNLLEL